MKQSLDLGLTQRLAMTPQLQQAIKLLQLSTTELQLEVQQALDSNPLLEEKEAVNGSAEEEADDGLPDPWQLSGQSPWQTVRNRGSGGDDGMEIDARNSGATSLYDYLLRQVSETPFSDADRLVAETLIGNLNKDGYLSSSPEEILQSLSEDGLDLEIDEVEAVLHQVQNFEPSGVCARDLRECLLIQLRQLPNQDKATSIAFRLVDEHLDKLAKKDFIYLKKQLGVNDEGLHSAIELTQSLNPRPGSVQSDSGTQYITPDVIIRRHRDRWIAVLCEESMPRIQINQSYQSLIKRGDSSDDNTYLRDNLIEARWLLKSLQNRNETVLRVASAIVERQQAFFDLGEQVMKPMVLQDIARELDIHESTVSRATVNKYMHTPRGIYEFRFFFSSGLGAKNGEETSSTAVQSLIKEFIDKEPSKKPLSDSKIVAMLAERGYQVARRTVAKYRDLMQIPPSSQRKTLF